MDSVYLIESSTLAGIASAIRSKTGTSSAFTPAQMITEIENMEIGGVIFHQWLIKAVQ